MIEVKPLTEATREDAKQVIRDRFDESACELLDMEMRNPLRSRCAEAGDIAYDDGRPVCFQACILRRLYLGSEEVVGKVSGLTCVREGADVSALIDIRAAACKVRAGSRMGFGNSQNAETARIAHRAKNVVEGPESCTRVLWRAVRPLECFAYFVRRKLLKARMPAWKSYSTLGSAGFETKCGGLEVRRVMEVKPEFYDVLMKRYLETNEGLVCSRTAEEIEWIFGERIRNGQVVVLGAFDATGPVGYILLNGGAWAKRWAIHDWFAIRNDVLALRTLLDAACRFLKSATPAMMLECKGFPPFVQSLLKNHLPHVRQIGHNVFSCGSREPELREKLRKMATGELTCWFFGPYDGDICF